MSDRDPGCLFCRIVAGEIPSKRVFETESVLAFHDINPQAPVHGLVIPKAHIVSLNDITESNAAVMGDLFLAARRVAAELGVAASGWRAVFNCGRDAQMAVDHLHLHVLGGRPMKWPPG